MTRLRAAIVDDEPLARERMRTLLDISRVDVIGEAASVEAAMRLVRRGRPDLVLLDVELPDGTGFDVVSAFPSDDPPLVIVVTAFDSYAVRAFEAAAVDYVLKPVDPERLREALQRARERAWRADDGDRSERLRALARAFADARQTGRIVLRDAARSYFVDTADILWVEAKRNTCLVHLRDRTLVVRDTMTSFQARLPTSCFVRAHRSAIVNLSHVKYAESYFRGEYVLVLRDGTRVVTSRTHGSEIHRYLASC